MTEVKIGALKAVLTEEARVGMTPESASHLRKLGHECLIGAGTGVKAGFSDEESSKAGTETVETGAALFATADVALKAGVPAKTGLERLREGQTLICFFNPGGNEAGLNWPGRRVRMSSR